jgi:hypothetical protein
MKKIPLGSTIAGSYGFLFTNIISIIGTMWLPVLLFAALFGAFICQMIPHEWFQGHFPEHVAKDDMHRLLIAHLPIVVAGVFGLTLASVLMKAMINVGILRHAIGEKTSTTFIWFSLGARVWRMVAMSLLFLVVYVVVEIAAVILFAILNVVLHVVPLIPHVVQGLANAALAVAALLAIMYVMIRIFFFLPAVIVAEHRISPSRAWELSKGNVWRIVVLILAVVVPVCVLTGVVVCATLFTTVVPEAVRQHPKGPEQAFEFLKSILPVLPVIAGIYLVSIVAVTGLALGAIGRAYKAVTAPDEATS